MIAVFASTLIFLPLQVGDKRGPFSSIIGKDPTRLNNSAGANDFHRLDLVLGPDLGHRRRRDGRAGGRRGPDLPLVQPSADPARGAVQPVSPAAIGAGSGPGER